MPKTDDQPKLIETICWEDGQAPLLSYHQARVDASRRHLLGIKRRLNLDSLLKRQSLPLSGRHKVRLLYRQEVEDFSCAPYQIHSVESLRLVEIDGLNYRYKFADRRALEDAFSRREGCDEVIIVWRGYLTDATYANLALFDGQHWWTPAHPLLKGVRRSSLLAEGRIRPAVIRAADLKLFKEIKLINAMLSLKDTRGVPVSKVLAPGQAW